LIGVGPALALLEGAAAGAAAGTLTGALGGLGFWEETADIQARDLDNGRIWVGIETDTQLDTAEAALREAGAETVSRTGVPGT
jgi:hypothetical protein